MADWERASQILSAAPKFSPGDETAQQSMRLWQSLQTKLCASGALTTHARNLRITAAETSLEKLGVDEKRQAAEAVIRHFSALSEGRGAIQDALRPIPHGSVFWADPALHDQIGRFLRALDDVKAGVGAESGTLEWMARFSPASDVIDARVSEAAAAYESLKDSFEKMCAVRESMQALDNKELV